MYQEKGEIFFFYRPKVEREKAHSSDDVQRLYIVLRPEEIENKQESSHESIDVASSPKRRKLNENEKDNSAHEKTASTGQHKDTAESGKGDVQEVNNEKQMLMRLMVMGKKSLPDPHQKRGRPYWGFVEMVTNNIDDLMNALKGEEYDTATRGHRHTSNARALGEGVYQILKHINPGGKNKKPHTHLIYKLRFPSATHKDKNHETPQESLNVEKEASFLLQIKNPSIGGSGGGFRGLTSDRKAKFPPHLEEKFGKLRYSPADPTDFLDYEGCEFLLIAASDDVSEELGLEIETGEYKTPDEAEKAAAPCSDLLKTFGENGIGDSPSSSSIAPLLKGIWA